MPYESIDVMKSQFFKLKQGASVKISTKAKAKFGVDTRVGKQIYEAITDEELFAVLRRCNGQRRVPPYQGMLNKLMMEYLLHRFGTWENVIIEAGLTREILQSKPKPKPTFIRKLEENTEVS